MAGCRLFVGGGKCAEMGADADKRSRRWADEHVT